MRSPSGHLAISAEDPLHLDSLTTRIIKSGIKCIVCCLGGSYKLRRGWGHLPLAADSNPGPLVGWITPAGTGGEI